MGVFTRKDSPWFWLWLETAPRGQQREKTQIKVGTTTAQRQDSRRLADALYHQRMNELASRIHRLPQRRASITFADWVAWWRVHKMPHHRGQHREAQILKTLLAGFGSRALLDIDTENVSEWMTRRRLAVCANTINREVALLKALLRDAVPKHLDASPLKGMKQLQIVKPKRRLLTPAEERKLLPKLGPVDRAIFLMGLDGLVRLGDILDLRRDDDRGRTLYIREPKDPRQADPYEVPVSTRLRAALDAVPVSDSPYYFAKRRQAHSEDSRRLVIRKVLERACKAAGLRYGRANGGITFHWATRRTGASRMIQRQVDIKTVQAVGHWKRPDVVLEIYAEATTKAMRQAVEVVGPATPDGAKVWQKHRQKRAS